MQELTFEQVEVVSGGFQGLTAPGDYFQNDQYFTAQDSSSGSSEATGGTGGQTIGGALMGGTNFVGGVIIGGLSMTAGAAVGLVGWIASTAFSATQEGRDGMRVQNHPATRHLYNADGSKK